VLGRREYMCVRKKGIQVCQEEGTTGVSEGREFICVRWKVIHVRQEESNTNLLAGVSEGRGHRCVKRNGTQVCNEEGNTCVSTGRENRSVREKNPLLLIRFLQLFYEIGV
jgi:hypothetical protein